MPFATPTLVSEIDALRAERDMLLAERDRLRVEVEEQARVNGMGAEREAEIRSVLNIALHLVPIDTQRLRGRIAATENLGRVGFYEGESLAELERMLDTVDRFRRVVLSGCR